MKTQPKKCVMKETITRKGGSLYGREKYINEGKSVAWLSYLGILVIIPILLQKENPYTKFHIKQGLVLLVASIVWIVASWILAFIPILGTIIALLGWLVLVILAIIGIVNALQGKEAKLPFLGDYGDKFSF